MARPTLPPTGIERTFGHDEIIVSKTDPTGVITYANDVFCRVAGYTEEELLGQQHNIVRHPAMPRCVFKYLWDTIAAGHEVFAYVINQARNGDHYWVYAHVTATYDDSGNIVSYHSSRRLPDPGALEVVSGLYEKLLKEEKRHSSPKEGMEASFNMLVGILTEAGVSYDEFIFSLLRKSEDE